MANGELAPREANEMLQVVERGARIISALEAADAQGREGQPRHVEVTWVEPGDIEHKRKKYWKAKYAELYGPVPEPPDPEAGGWLPPEIAPAVDKPNAPADPGGGGPVPSPAVAGDRTRNNGNNENNENTMDAARLAAGDPNGLTDIAGARRQEDEPPLPPLASQGSGVDNRTAETMETTKIQRPRRGRRGGPAAAVARGAPRGR
jgi:hypothetical protein